MTPNNEPDLTKTFAVWQLIAAISGLFGSIIFGLFSPAPALTWVAIISGANALACLAVLGLLRLYHPKAATYLLVASGLASIAAASPVVGSSTSAPALYVWPPTTAALLLGAEAGVGFGLLAFACFIGASIFEHIGVYHPLLAGDLAQYVGTFSLLLAMALAVVVASAAVGNIRREAARATSAATEAEQKSAQLEQAFRTEGQTKADALALANQLNEAAIGQAHIAAGAAASTSQVTAQVAELTAAARQIAESARQVRDSSDRTHATATAAVTQMAAEREHLAQAGQASTVAMEAAKQVSGATKQMATILSLITEIAEETHMLSLNATIEAGGSSEQGRRFGVIANEVGRVAGRVNEAVEEVGGIVSRVQTMAQSILKAATVTANTISDTQAANLAASEQIAEVSEAANRTAHEGFMIVSSTAQQERSTSLIAGALEQVSHLAGDAASASNQLNNLAAALKQTVAQLAEVAPEVIEKEDGDTEGRTLTSSSNTVTTPTVALA